MRIPPRQPLTTFLLLLLFAAPVAADRLELKDGSQLQGRFVEDTGTHVLFLVDGELEARKLRHSEVLTLGVDFAARGAAPKRDPQWTEERVQARIQKSFNEDHREDVSVFRSKHFILFSLAPGGAKQSKKFLERDMERIYEAFAETFPFKEPAEPELLPLFLLKDHEQYTLWSMRAAGWSYEQASKSAGHAYKDYFATYFTGAANPTVWHETAHQLVGNRLGIHGGGSWFQEGMAVYFEDKWKNSERVESVISGKIKSDLYTPFRELFNVGSLLHSGGDNARENKASQRYLQAGSIFYFLAESSWRVKLPDLFEALRKNSPGSPGRGAAVDKLWDKIFLQVYGVDVDGVEAAWKTYYLKKR